MQRPAKPSTPVRFRPPPPYTFHTNPEKPINKLHSKKFHSLIVQGIPLVSEDISHRGARDIRMPWQPYSQNFSSVCHIACLPPDTALSVQSVFHLMPISLRTPIYIYPLPVISNSTGNHNYQLPNGSHSAAVRSVEIFTSRLHRFLPCHTSEIITARGSRSVSGQSLVTAFQNPREPSPIANLGAILRPRCFKSVNTSSQLAADSR